MLFFVCDLVRVLIYTLLMFPCWGNIPTINSMGAPVMVFEGCLEYENLCDWVDKECIMYVKLPIKLCMRRKVRVDL